MVRGSLWFGIRHLPMKPNHEVALAKRLSRSDNPDRRGGSFPQIVSAFQAPRGDGFNYGGGGRPNRPRGFTQLAREVFRGDARRSLSVEIVLGSITLATAWQIADMLREVFVVLKNGGIY